MTGFSSWPCERILADLRPKLGACYDKLVLSNFIVTSPEYQTPEVPNLSPLPQIELMNLSPAGLQYLRELWENLPADEGYVIVFPGGQEEGYLGMSEAYPALSLERVLMYLANYFLEQDCVSEVECRRNKVVPVRGLLQRLSPGHVSNSTTYILQRDGSVTQI